MLYFILFGILDLTKYDIYEFLLCFRRSVMLGVRKIVLSKIYFLLLKSVNFRREIY